MNAASFIAFFTYMLRKNVISERKLAANINEYKMCSSSYRHLYEGYPYVHTFYEANCSTRFGSCADIVSYLCKF